MVKKTRKLLTLAGLWSLGQKKEQAIELLQVCCVAGRPFDGYVYYHSLSLVPRSSVVSKRLLEGLFAEESVCGEEVVRRRIEEDTQAVLGALETYQAVQVVYLRLSYLVEKGKCQAESRVPWLMFAEECIVRASSRHRPVQLDAEPVIRQNRTPPRLKSRIQRRITSLNASFLPDPQLSIVTLASIHHSQLSKTGHKSTQEILADVRKRQTRYGQYRSLKILPKDSENSDISRQSVTCVLENSEESLKWRPERREVRRKEAETSTSAEEMTALLQIHEKKEKKQSQNGLKCRLSSGKLRESPKFDLLTHFLSTSLAQGKCPGDFCTLKLQNDQIDPKRRYPVLRKWLKVGKLQENSPLNRPELLIPPSDAVSTGNSSENVLSSKCSPAFEDSRTEVCFRCFVVYENLRKLLE